ncbi:MAG: hypothetical protein EBU46_10130, partial [Nitrosomonadaceae bacterium]|nr:hypothetical protein [Nitrosomonadaceae bacterium]
TEFVWPSLDLPVIGTQGTCKGLSNHFGVLAEGTVVPCCLDKEAAIPLGNALETSMPDGGFYLWARTVQDDTVFARELLQAYNVTVLPGSYLARDAHGVNPGKDFVRIALVTSPEECIEAMNRIKRFMETL